MMMMMTTTMRLFAALSVVLVALSSSANATASFPPAFAQRHALNDPCVPHFSDRNGCNAAAGCQWFHLANSTGLSGYCAFNCQLAAINDYQQCTVPNTGYIVPFCTYDKNHRFCRNERRPCDMMASRDTCPWPVCEWGFEQSSPGQLRVVPITPQNETLVHEIVTYETCTASTIVHVTYPMCIIFKGFPTWDLDDNWICGAIPICTPRTTAEACLAEDACTWYNDNCELHCERIRIDTACTRAGCVYDPVSRNCSFPFIHNDELGETEQQRMDNCAFYAPRKIWDAETSRCVQNCSYFETQHGCETGGECRYVAHNNTCIFPPATGADLCTPFTNIDSCDTATVYGVPESCAYVAVYGPQTFYNNTDVNPTKMICRANCDVLDKAGCNDAAPTCAWRGTPSWPHSQPYCAVTNIDCTQWRHQAPANNPAQIAQTCPTESGVCAILPALSPTSGYAMDTKPYCVDSCPVYLEQRECELADGCFWDGHECLFDPAGYGSTSMLRLNARHCDALQTWYDCAEASPYCEWGPDSQRQCRFDCNVVKTAEACIDNGCEWYTDTHFDRIAGEQPLYFCSFEAVDCTNFGSSECFAHFQQCMWVDRPGVQQCVTNPCHHMTSQERCTYLADGYCHWETTNGVGRCVDDAFDCSSLNSDPMECMRRPKCLYFFLEAMCMDISHFGYGNNELPSDAWSGVDVDGGEPSAAGSTLRSTGGSSSSGVSTSSVVIGVVAAVAVVAVVAVLVKKGIIHRPARVHQVHPTTVNVEPVSYDVAEDSA